ncbi:hypothetical protein EV143_11810 [Flavobacterium chryseum]|uniref:hypothetical protein n=1 Tax=Flavobacterium sp. P3160 TaxID=2512113 RepID=UPI00105FE34C|nr:hypothetical protein [Flavobacterium sp. P3160]TDO68826.1 hypothetical protein EV143_11810 [Flavobacterium sp. P3160]
MAENCDEKLTGQFVKMCGHRPKQGVAGKWYINHDDVDVEATQKSNRGTVVTTLVLKTGAKIYPAVGKKVSSIEHALAIKDFSNGYIHTDRFTITYKGPAERERVQELVDGARVVTLSKKVDTGISGELSYEIAGLESGMEITEDTFNSGADSGVTKIAVATKEGEEESTGIKLFKMVGGLDAIETWITTNEYVEPVIP